MAFDSIPSKMAPIQRPRGDAELAVRAVDRTIALIEALGDSDGGASLADLARATRLTEATALRYLGTLVRLDVAERDGTTGRYRLGFKLLLLGEKALGKVDPRRVARPHLERLRDRFGETVNLAAFREGRLVLLDVLEGTHAIKRGAQVGQEDPVHSTGLGKAVLANLQAAERIKLLAQVGMKRYTSHTIVDLEDLERELGQVRKVGYAVDHEESEPGLSCIGVAILDRWGFPAHAVSISGPTARIRPAIDMIANELLPAAADIGRQLGHSPSVTLVVRSQKPTAPSRKRSSSGSTADLAAR